MLPRFFAALIVSTGLVLPVAGATAAPDDGAVNVSSSDTVQALRGTTSEITLAVPAGLTPTELRGEVVREDVDMSAIVTVNGTAIHTAEGPVEVDRFRAAVPRAERDAKELTIGLRYVERPDGAARCRDWTSVYATLRDLTVRYAGQELAPTTVADFFAPVSPSVIVQVPTDADAQVAGAALAASAALARRYPRDTSIRIVEAGESLPSLRPGSRLVRIQPGTGASITEVGLEAGWPTLTISGDEGLVAAAAALADRSLDLSSSESVDELGIERTPVTADPPDTMLDRPLTDVVSGERLSLTGYGTVSRFIDLPQSVFGGPVSAIDLDLVGTHTAVPDGGRVQLDVLANDLLVDSLSFAPGDDSGFTASVDVPDTALRGTNTVELRMSAVPPGGDCAADFRQLPVEVHVDLGASRVEATRGNGRLTGFARFPQVLGSRLPVAIRSDDAGAAAGLIRAGAIVVALQRAAAQPIEVTMVDADDFVAGDDSGLLVGATADDAAHLDAPLRLDEARVMTYADAEIQAISGAPFAALEAFRHDGRDLLMLGGWSAAGNTEELADRLTALVERDGWGSLSADVLAAAGDSRPFVLDSNSVIPQKQRVDDRRGFAVWLGVGLGVLIVLLVANAYFARRRRARMVALVDAQAAADKDAPDHNDDRMP